MIVDTSALLTILLDEPGAEEVARAIVSSGGAAMSAANYVEASAVLDRRGDPVASRRLDQLMEVLQIEIVPFDEAQARVARDAYRDFGRGNGHPARLNLGDVFAYALAQVTRRPLLFIGGDFSSTDITPALPRTGR